MYLRELFIRDSGPIRELLIEPTFDDESRPIPHIIVGRNGTGKTNLLSIITEALMHGASGAYNDVLRTEGFSHSYFRILGGTTVAYGAPAGFSILRFSHNDEDMYFHEKSGEITASQAAEIVPASLAPGTKWGDKSQSKEFTLPSEAPNLTNLGSFGSSGEKAKDIYPLGVYVYFPASRSEHPFWFNQDSVADDGFDVSDRYSNNLGKPMFVEHGIDAMAQWLLGVLTESRLPVISARYLTDEQKQFVDKNEVVIQLNAENYLATQKPLVLANDILRAIVGDESAYFDWMGRHSSKKVGIFAESRTIGTSLNALSGGQATLLSIFGTILRYADASSARQPNVDITDIEGIVIIDELDAHMHIDLQLDAIPKLIRLFPRIQFFVSSHSPFFTLGMERTFSPAGIRVLDMPDGNPVTAESYEEFGYALKAFRRTEAFEDEIKVELERSEEPVIWLAGETDVPYFQTAAELLGFSNLKPHFQWIGTPGASGGGDYTGDNSLKTTVKFLRANTGFSSRKNIFVFDCDAGQHDDQFDSVHIFSLARIADARVADGVENLLPREVFTEDVFQDKEIDSGIEGKPKIIPEIRKTLLSGRLCGEGADPVNFQNFRPILERIASVISPPSEADESVDDALEPPADAGDSGDN